MSPFPFACSNVVFPQGVITEPYISENGLPSSLLLPTCSSRGGDRKECKPVKESKWPSAQTAAYFVVLTAVRVPRPPEVCILRGPTECRRKPMPASPARVWRGPGTRWPPPRPPKSVGKAALVGVGGRPHGNPCVLAVYRGHAAHPGPAEVVHATNCDRLGSEDGSRARWPTSLAVFAAHSAQATSSAGVCRVRIGCHTSNRDAQAMRARQHVRTSCHELREAARGSGCNAHRRVARCWFLKCERMPTRSSRRRRVRLEGETCRGSTFASEPRPRACTPGAMDARNWSRLMCLETQGTRGGGPALVLDGMAEELTHTQLGST